MGIIIRHSHGQNLWNIMINVQFVFSHSKFLFCWICLFQNRSKVVVQSVFLYIVGVQGVFLPKDVMVFVIAGGDSRPLSRPCFTAGRGSFHRPTRP